ncbi:MAG: peptide/nickel transport system substrate-binding protein [Acetobacteraceae bacterium]|nr:peptide/nickel transport system substrate-binding protein [Acetobacteraceae bacterium]
MKRRAIVALACMLLSWTAHTGSAQAGDGKRVLRVVPSADLSELDPTMGANLISRIYQQMVFDTLFALDGNLLPKPMMVDRESISADGLIYTFTLRSGLKFHDGSAVTTRDVVASLQRWMGGTSVGAQLQSRLAGLAVVDDLTFTLSLKQPFGLVEFMLAGPRSPIAGIMREADATRPASQKMTEPIGSGPFRYVAAERVVGGRAVFERNPDYIPRGEPTSGLAGARIVKVDRVEWTIMPDATTAANALITNEVDFWDAASPDLVPFLIKNGIVVRRTVALPSVAFVRPNFQLPPFNDVRAREALALLVDQREMMQAVSGDGGKWQECYSFSVCGSAYGTESGSGPYRKPDIARARQLFIEAGYKGEPIVLLGTPQLAPINAMTQVLASRLQEAGLNVDVQMTDFTSLLQRVNMQNKPIGGGGYHLFAYYATGISWFHPLLNMALESSCEGRNWPGFPCDPVGEALRQKFLVAPDEAARKAAFEALEKRAWAFLPYIPAGQFDVVNAYRSNVAGVLDSSYLAYWNIEKN